MNTCKIITRPKQLAIAVRTRSPVQNLPDLIGKTYEEIGRHLQSINAMPSDAPYIGYFNMDMDDLDVEIGFPVSHPLTETDNIKMVEIPEGQYASTLYVGPYSNLKEGYHTLMKYMEDEKLTMGANAYEFYLNDPATTQENDLETLILFQLKV